MTTPVLTRITGSLAEVRPFADAGLYQLVRAGDRRLLAEVVRVDGDTATIQVYEDTTGLAVGEPVETTGAALSIDLGPGLLGSVLDGVGRPLGKLALAGDFIRPGAEAPTLDAKQVWQFEPIVAVGTTVGPGDVLGTIEEKPGVLHRVMVAPGHRGVVTEIARGEVASEGAVGRLEDGTPLTVSHRWPVREPRPVGERLPNDRPLVTGQRVFDFLFPVAEGGTVAVPGGFGTGKTVIEQSIAKYADADIVVYIGCGERGNEMAELLTEFPRLVDPRTGRSIMDRTVMVVNTSNMPVAARESSIYVGITIAEFYRDMGFRVALMADSLSRWAEALREIGARLGAMPGEEGYPTYLPQRLGKFYERAGRAVALGVPERTGAITVIAAVSPPGGDFSEPVTQASLRVAGALWALDPAVAHQRQFPAVDWATSYSLYRTLTDSWFATTVGPDWPGLVTRTLDLLQRGEDLKEIAGLVGPDALQDADRLTLEAARLVREIVLGQSAYAPNDAFSPLAKTRLLASLALRFADAGLVAIAAGTTADQLQIGPVRQALARLRDSGPDQLEAAAAVVEATLAQLGKPPS